MPKGRMLNKKISKDLELAKLSCKAALLYTWCIPHLDVEGRIEASPEIIKGVVLPYRNDFTIAVIKKCVEEIVATTDLIVYYGKKHKYMEFMGFNKNQTVNKDRESPSEIPPPTPEEVKSSSGLSLNTNINISLNTSIIEDIVTDLNLVLGTAYKTTSLKIKELIQARINEGHTLDDFKTVHRKMAKAWFLDNKMRPYLRPITLYSNKFESYLNRPEEIKDLTAAQKSALKQLEELRKEKKDDQSNV